jgi:hypothetical protein
LTFFWTVLSLLRFALTRRFAGASSGSHLPKPPLRTIWISAVPLREAFAQRIAESEVTSAAVTPNLKPFALAPAPGASASAANAARPSVVPITRWRLPAATAAQPNMGLRGV